MSPHAKDEPIEVELKDMVRCRQKSSTSFSAPRLRYQMVFLFLSALFDAFVNIMIEEETNDGVRCSVWERYKLPLRDRRGFWSSLRSRAL